jgi:transcriptional regulator with XRE-family HTH domain
MKIYDYNGKKNISGERIQAARRKMKITQGELAARLQVEGINIERDSISRIEIGTRFVADYELLVISRILGVSVDYLLGIEVSI